ncbi:hypothetical protein BB987_17370 [Photorhabdus temperata]|uniref:Choline-glycine betaine transporter n=1 Tax=Photorhabdus khanii NC19 TaxID=1004151 RepID=W3V7S7_9GAMM|nr:hypothetical protein [Photorhabdus khanii]ETS31897.1 choline-glycine betaine transporter [Photorhabdus khanii NC19]OHV51249.1 hypothetical protein BB987_17370 [Photorhabdus temperata]
MMGLLLATNLNVACILVLLLAVLILIKYRNVTYNEKEVPSAMPASQIVFLCILFTSGLDIGLIMFPLMEYKNYTEPKYLGINPLSLEIGFWGGAVWVFYFITTFYFAYLEPKVKIFENNVIKFILALLMLLTCAFTAHLFVIFFKYYLPEFVVKKYDSIFTHENIVIFTVGILSLSALSALKVKFIKILSYLSVLFFGGLIFWGFALNIEQHSLPFFFTILGNGITGYIKNISKFITPINDYHQFYMFWWFSWSLMIGKFVATFLPKGMKPLKLFLLMIIAPTILLAIWFTVLYIFTLNNFVIPEMYLVLMSIVGLLFVINSFDSILRVSANLLKNSISLSKYRNALFIAYVLLVVFFIGYAGFTNSSEGIIKIDYTGTLAILIIYYMLYCLARNYLSRKKVS